MTAAKQHMVLPPISSILPPQYFTRDPTVPSVWSQPQSCGQAPPLQEPYAVPLQRYTTTATAVEDHASPVSYTASSSVSGPSSGASLVGQVYGSHAASEWHSAVPQHNPQQPLLYRRFGSFHTASSPVLAPVQTLSHEHHRMSAGHVLPMVSPLAQTTPGASPSYVQSPLHSAPHSHCQHHDHPHDCSPSVARKSPTVKPKSATKAHVCEICGKRFTRPSALSTHMLVHSGDKPFVCTWKGCNKRFNVKSNLIRHLRLHKEKEARQNSAKAPAKSTDEDQEV